MRWYAVGLIALTLAGCGSKYKAEGPVLDNWERVRGWSNNDASRARYSGQPVVDTPVLPVLAFGAHFDLDVIVSPKNDRWDQAEIARMDTPAGPLWLALESRTNSKEQILVADLPQIDALMPEIPLTRKASRFEVEDTSNDEHVVLSIKYENADGDPVELKVESDPPHEIEEERNLPIHGHSASSLLLLADAPARQSAFSVDLKIDGQAQNMRKVGGLVPFQYVGTQAMGGLAVGSFTMIPTETFAFDSTMAEIVVRGADVPAPVVAEAPAEPVEADPLTKALATSRDDLQGCYTQVAKGNPELAGQVLLSFEVAAGKADAFSVISNTTQDEALATCLTEKLGGVTFPDAIAGKTAYPFVFEKSSGLVFAMAVDAEDEALPESEELPEGDLMADLPDPGAVAADAAAALDDEELVDDMGAEGAPVPEGWGPKLAHFKTVHAMPSGNTVEMAWEVTRKGERVFAVQHSDLRTLTYEYLVHHDALELARVSVTQYGQAVPTTEISFSPALPDLRRGFDGRQQSRFVVDINGQENYAVGTAEAWWTESGVKIKLAPEAPEWAVGRPMTTTISYGQGGQTQVLVQRIE